MEVGNYVSEKCPGKPCKECPDNKGNHLKSCCVDSNRLCRHLILPYCQKRLSSSRAYKMRNGDDAPDNDQEDPEEVTVRRDIGKPT